jgi:hypothetical protein
MNELKKLLVFQNIFLFGQQIGATTCYRSHNLDEERFEILVTLHE